MEEYSFIDNGLKDFLRDENNQVIIKKVGCFEEAEEWLLENGKKYGWTNTGVKYYEWSNI